MSPDIFAALGRSLHYEDYRGDFSQAASLCEQWLAGAAGEAAREALLYKTAIAILSGGIVEAVAALDELEALAGEQADALLMAQTLRLWLMYEQYNLFPDHAGAGAVEVSARWRGGPDLQSADERWQALRARASDPDVLWLSWYIYGFLCNLLPARYMLESARFSPPAFDKAKFLAGQLQMMESLRQQAQTSGQPLIAGYACRCAADLCRRSTQADEAAAWLDRAESVAIAHGDAHDRGVVLMMRADWGCAPFSSPPAWNFALQDSSSEASHLPATIEAMERQAPDAQALARAREQYDVARVLFQEAGSPRALAALECRQAYLAALARDYAEAARHALSARRAFDQASDYKGAHLAGAHLAMAELGRDRRAAAEDAARAIGEAGRSQGNFSFSLGLGVLLNRFARHLMLREARLESALAAYQCAGVLHEALNARINAAQNLTDQGVCLQAVGDNDAALNFFEAGLEAYEEALRHYMPAFPGAEDAALNVWQRLVFLGVNGFQLSQRGLNPEGMRFFAGRLKALLDRLPVGDEETLKTELGALLSGRQPRRALSEGVDFWSLRHLAIMAINQAAILAPLYAGRLARKKGDMPAAARYWEEALAALEQLPPGDRPWMEAIVHSENKAYEKAAEAYQRHLDRQKEKSENFVDQLAQLMGEAAGQFGQKEELLHTRRQHEQNLTMWVRLRQYEKARAELESLQALAGPDWWRDDRRPWQALSDCAEIFEHFGRFDRALAYYHDAIESLEARRGQLSRDEWKTALAGDRGAQYVYFLAARAALRSGMPAEAFHLIEQGKARALLDLMSGGERDAGPAASADAAANWREINARLSLHRGLLASERLAAQSSPERIEQYQRAISENEAALRAAERRLEAENPDFFRAVSAQAQIATAEQIAHKLSPGQVLLEYAFLGEDLLIWALDAAGMRQALRLDCDAEALERDIVAFHRRCREKAPLDELGERLAGQLLAPVAESLAAARSLTIVAYGALHRLPFAALPWRGRPLAETHTLSYLPSAAVLRYLSPPDLAGRRSLLAAGDPNGDLPSAGAEAAYVAALHDAEALIGEEATEPAVRARLGEVELLHFATHGRLSETSPLLSAIVLAQGEELTLYELMGLRLRAELAVLSACETALGATTGGEDVLGLTRGLLAAGAKSALVTLWEVDDWSTCLLMRSFHSRLRAGVAPAAALQQAQGELRALRREDMMRQLRELELPVQVERQRGILLPGHAPAPRDEDLTHPYYWAAFVLVSA
jgi:CHAT domain-containing protein